MMEDKDNFKILLAKKDSPTLDEHFDDMVMNQVMINTSRVSDTSRSLRLMYLYFGAGFILGLVVMLSITSMSISIVFWEFTIDPMMIQFGVVLLLLLLLDRVYKARRFTNENTKVSDD